MNNKEVCQSKVKYTTENIAKEVLSYLNNEGFQDYYRCSVCKCYHLYTLNRKVCNKRRYINKKDEKERLDILSKFKKYKGRPRRKR